MHEFGLGHFVEQYREEIRHLHAHRHRVELSADRVLHPSIGDQDPQRREVRTNGDQPGDDQMRDLAQLVPAEKEQPDKGCLKKEGHQPFDRQRRPENVADIMAVIAPVHPELKFHGDSGGNSEGEIDAEQQAPEFGHLPPYRAVGHHVDRFHDRHEDREPQCQRNKEEVIHDRHGKLQP